MTAPAKRPITVDARVRITQGPAAGIEGVVVEKWLPSFGKQPIAQWRISSDDLTRSRVMRADFLEVVGP